MLTNQIKSEAMRKRTTTYYANIQTRIAVSYEKKENIARLTLKLYTI